MRKLLEKTPLATTYFDGASVTYTLMFYTRYLGIFSAQIESIETAKQFFSLYSKKLLDGQTKQIAK